MFLKIRARFLNEAAGGEAGGAGGAAAGGGSPAGAGGTPAAGATPPGDGASSVLALGAGTPALADRIPEKYRVVKDGALDLEASAGKLAEGYGNLEKMLGSRGAAPAAAADYKVTIPEQHAEALKGWDQAGDQLLQGFLADAHKAGLTQSQLDLVMGRYFEMAPKLAAASQIKTPQQQAAECLTDLQGRWGDKFKEHIGGAFKVAALFGKDAGITQDDLKAAGLDNNPVFLRLMAQIAPELAEDGAPIADGSPEANTWSEQVAKLKSERDALKESDPLRKVKQEQINKLYAQRYGTQPAA